MNKVLIATKNAGKAEIYKPAFAKLGISVCTLKDLNIDFEVEENGETEEENAIIKAMAYHKATGLPVMANDSGLYLDKFKPEDQPGLFVRRYHGKELTDEELLKLYQQKLEEVGGESEGHFNVGIAIIDEKGQLHSRSFKPKRYYISKASSVIKKGVPLSSLSIDRKTNKYLSEMTIEERNIFEGEEFAKQEEFILEVFGKGENI